MSLVEVGESYGSLEGFAIRLSKDKIHLELRGTGLTLNLTEDMAKHMGQNLLRARKIFLDMKDIEGEQPVRVIKEFSPVKVSARGFMKALDQAKFEAKKAGIKIPDE